MTIDIPLRGRDGTRRATAVVDAADADLAHHRWHYAPPYAVRAVYADWDGTGKKYQRKFGLHRAVLERKLGRPIGDGLYAEHVDGNGLNNTRDNLREASNAENQQNRRGPDAKNTTGYRNVYRSGDRFHVSVRVLGKDHNGGMFDSAEEAAIAADALRRQLGVLDGAAPPVVVGAFVPTPRQSGKRVRRDVATGYRGVWYAKDQMVYRAYACPPSGRQWNGAYATAEEAAVAAHQLRLRLGIETDPSPAWLPDVQPRPVVQKASSRYKGVTFAAARGKWAAQAHKDGRAYSAGRFNTEEEAAVAAHHLRLKLGLETDPNPPWLPKLPA